MQPLRHKSSLRRHPPQLRRLLLLALCSLQSCTYPPRGRPLPRWTRPSVAPFERLSLFRCPPSGISAAKPGCEPSNGKLSSIFPSLARAQRQLAAVVQLLPEWNVMKNGHLGPEMTHQHSERAVWWRCELGHEVTWCAVRCVGSTEKLLRLFSGDPAL